MKDFRAIIALVAVIALLTAVVVIRELQHRIAMTEIEREIERERAQLREAKLSAEKLGAAFSERFDALTESARVDSIEAAGHVERADAASLYHLRRSRIPTASDSALSDIILWRNER